MHDATLEPLLPLFLRLQERPVLVVGGGVLGTRKVDEMLEIGAQVTVVARQASASIREWAAQARLVLHERDYRDSDILTERPYLVIATTGDAAVHARVHAAAERRRCFVVALDEPAYASAFFGSIVRRPPFLIAISSHGRLPALTRLVREVLESALPPTHMVEHARELRRRWKRDEVPMGARFDQLFEALWMARNSSK